MGILEAPKEAASNGFKNTDNFKRHLKYGEMLNGDTTKDRFDQHKPPTDREGFSFPHGLRLRISS
ncbi:hypothetical protein Tco_0900983, partial [Tanacetum coccineum]